MITGSGKTADIAPNNALTSIINKTTLAIVDDAGFVYDMLGFLVRAVP